MSDQNERPPVNDDYTAPIDEAALVDSAATQPAQPDGLAQEATPISRDVSMDLMVEVRELGTQLEAAFRAAIESDRTKQLQRDLMGGLKELSGQVQSALRNAQDDPRVQQASERGREVLRNAQQSKAAAEIQETLVSGIAQLNLQVRKLVERLETPQTTSTPTQHIPVEHDAAIGETTRLEDDSERDQAA